MEFKFTDAFGQTTAALDEHTLCVSARGKMGSESKQRHPITSIWPVISEEPLPEWLRALLMLPGSGILLAVLCWAWPLYRYSAPLYIVLVVAALSILLYGAWLGSATAWCHLTTKDNRLAMRCIGTRRNRTMLDRLLQELRTNPEAKAAPGSVMLDLPDIREVPSAFRLRFTQTAEDRAHQQKIVESQTVREARSSALVVLFIIYWFLTTFALGYILDEKTDMSTLLLSFGAIGIAFFAAAAQSQRMTAGSKPSEEKSRATETECLLTPSAMVLRTSSSCLLLEWCSTIKILTGDDGITLIHRTHVVHLPHRAFSDGSHRGSFLSGLVMYAPHLADSPAPRKESPPSAQG